ncbi:MAG: hypothetical protein MPK62_02220 [Alphaproteobacteria bacterium]|nr:hypothetical protein [Alphaproteobacteria bacterium]MDA8029950.1 hypothetical protein [Alphaproteobacteria bacterium]
MPSTLSREDKQALKAFVSGADPHAAPMSTMRFVTGHGGTYIIYNSAADPTRETTKKMYEYGLKEVSASLRQGYWKSDYPYKVSALVEDW